MSRSERYRAGRANERARVRRLREPSLPLLSAEVSPGECRAPWAGTVDRAGRKPHDYRAAQIAPGSRRNPPARLAVQSPEQAPALRRRDVTHSAWGAHAIAAWLLKRVDGPEAVDVNSIFRLATGDWR